LNGIHVRSSIKTYAYTYISAGFADPFMVETLVAPQSYALKPGLHYDLSQCSLEHKRCNLKSSGCDRRCNMIRVFHIQWIACALHAPLLDSLLKPKAYDNNIFAHRGQKCKKTDSKILNLYGNFIGPPVR